MVVVLFAWFIAAVVVALAFALAATPIGARSWK